MDSIIEIYVSGNTNSGTTGAFIDTYENEPIVIDYSVKDIKDFSATVSNGSYSFKVPGTKNNNITFGQIFEIGIDGNFNPAKKARSYITIDSVPIISGNLQLLSCDVNDKENIVYDFTIFGETSNFNDAIKEDYLTDIDFSELNHTLSMNNISTSWTSNTATLGYYYPLIDYGYDFTNVGLATTGTTVEQFFPALSVKYLFDKIFSAAGFTYTSNFLNSSAFTETIIPYNGLSDFTTDKGLGTAYTFNVGNGYDFQQPFSAYTNWTTTNVGGIRPLEIVAAFAGVNKTTSGYFDNGNGVVDIGFGVNGYSAQTISSQRFTANMGWTLFASGNTAGDPSVNQFSPSMIGFKWYRSTYGGFATPFHIDTPLSNPNWIPGSPFYYNKITNFKSITPWLNNPLSSNYYPVQKNEIIVPVAYIYDPQKDTPFSGPPPSKANVVPVRIYSAYTYFGNEVSLQRVSGMTVNYNDYIPKKIKQVDIFKSLTKMFNLYVQPDKNNPKNLIIEPRDIYYSSGTTRTWVLDQTKPVNEQFLSEQQNKRYTFTYKEDKDFLNTNYKDAQNRIYGDYIYNVDNDFIKDEKVIDVIFSPTPNENVIGTDDFVLPQIYKLDANNNYGKTDFNIRLLRKNPTLQNLSGSTWNIAGGPSGMTKYPYASHLSEPFSSGGTDYNFGPVAYTYYNHKANYITTNNLVNTYWLNYLDTISDKDSKMITCYVKLTPKDIQEFNFWDKVFIDGMTDDGGHYFIVNSIQYNPTVNESSKVELLKLKSVKTNYVATVLDTVPSDTSSTARGAISLGGGKSSEPASISLGTANYTSSRNSVSVGDNSIIMPGADNSFIIGDNSRVNSGSENAFIFGDNSFIDTNSSNSFLVGSNSFVASGVTGVTIFGSQITATTSDTTYLNNVTIYSAVTLPGGVIYSAGTAPNFCVSGLKTSAISGCTTDISVDTNLKLNNSIKINGATAGFGQIDLEYFGTPGEVLISTDNGAAGQSYLDMTSGYFYAQGLNQLFLGTVSGNTLATSNIGVISNITLTSKNATIITAEDSTINTGAYNSVVVGGSGNTIATNITGSTIVGALSSIININGANNNIFGGVNNDCSGNNNIIVGGQSNIAALSSKSIILGGQSNSLGSGESSGIFAGSGNNISSSTSGATIIGSENSNLQANYSSIIGGQTNGIVGTDISTVIGGSGNTIFSTSASTINGGKNNTINGGGAYSSIIGGFTNLNSGYLSNSIIGGSNNYLDYNTNNASIVGGTLNQLGVGVVITNGSYCSTIIGGSGNTLTSSASGSTILGGKNILATTTDTVYLPKLKLQPTTTLPSPEIGMMFFSGAPLNRIMYNTGGTNADWKII